MTESSEKKSTGLPITAFASMFLLLLGTVVQHLNSLDSPRPATANSVISQFVNIEDVNARLWQDPFTAISKHEAKDETEICYSASSHTDKNRKDSNKYNCTSPHSIVAFIHSITEASNKNSNITVLGVMVSGGNYAENIESRRRTRYAVLSGLAVKNYVPKDQESIGYVQELEDMGKYAKGINNKNMMYMPEKIPFEWFQFDKDTNKSPAILILWLDDRFFASMPRPLQMTNDFVKLIMEATKPAKLKFKFIGPASSNTLQIMVDELAIDNAESCSKQDECAFKFYNANATGDWPGINIPATRDKREEWNFQQKTIQRYIESLENQHPGLSSLFTRTSLTDYQLAEAMLKELELRGFEPKKFIIPADSKDYPRDNQDHVVLISEWDTIYGRRGLPKAIKEQLVPMSSYCPNKDDIWKNKCSWPNDVHWIHSFSYMRGLDGVTLDTEKNNEEAKANKQKDNSTEINLERPEGESQQDYLRRLAEHIDEIKQQLINNGKGEEIKAIGVLGSDAYDKLLILKALRPFFPKALFFTTDLDTRLMHPKEFDVTRNLIVASSFDLQLAEHLQQSIPPFRDSYQTANFFATQIAMDDTGEKKLNFDIYNMLGEARLFETANNKAIPLNYSSAKSNDDCKELKTCKNVHPQQPPKNTTFNFSVLLLMTIVLWLLPGLYFLHKYWRLDSSKLWLSIFIIGTTVLIGTFAYVFSNKDMFFGQQGEPFFWNAGVSIWPSELVRLFAGLLACLFIVDTINAVVQNNRQLKEKFNCIRPLVGLSLPLENVEQLWQDHYSKITIRLYVAGLIALSAIFLCFGFSIIHPFVPYRGGISLYVHSVVLYFSVTVFVILLMTVFVTTFHSVRLIKKLDKLQSVWPDATLRHFSLLFNNPALNSLRTILKDEGKYHLDEWLDIQFIANHTKVVGQLIYYPFIVLALMIFARSKVFDNWDMPISLVITFLLAILLTLGSAFYLRRVAEHARTEVIKNISGMKMALSGRPQSESEARNAMEKQIDLALTQIQEINEGAFQPITSAPAFQAILIPFGGVGGVMLLENLVLGL